MFPIFSLTYKFFHHFDFHWNKKKGAINGVHWKQKGVGKGNGKHCSSIYNIYFKFFLALLLHTKSLTFPKNPQFYLTVLQYNDFVLQLLIRENIIYNVLAYIPTFGIMVLAFASVANERIRIFPSFRLVCVGHDISTTWMYAVLKLRWKQYFP